MAIDLTWEVHRQMYHVSPAATKSCMRQPPQASRFNHHNSISTLSQLAVALVSRSAMVYSSLGLRVQEQNRVRPATGEKSFLPQLPVTRDRIHDTI